MAAGCIIRGSGIEGVRAGGSRARHPGGDGWGMEGCSGLRTEAVEVPWVRIFQNRLDAIPCHVLRDGSAGTGSSDQVQHCGASHPDPSVVLCCVSLSVLQWIKRQPRAEEPGAAPGGAGSAAGARDGAWSASSEPGAEMGSLLFLQPHGVPLCLLGLSRGLAPGLGSLPIVLMWVP